MSGAPENENKDIRWRQRFQNFKKAEEIATAILSDYWSLLAKLQTRLNELEKAGQ